MTAMRQAAEDYLALRRSLGFKLEGPGLLVRQFAGWLDDRGDTHVRTESAIQWATLPACAAPYWHWLRLGAVRGLAAYLHGLDPAHQIPPADLLPRRYRLPPPACSRPLTSPRWPAPQRSCARRCTPRPTTP